MSVYLSTYTCSATLVERENPLPIFKDKQDDIDFTCTEKVPYSYSLNLGINCAKRLYPYKEQRYYPSKPKKMNIPSIVLENQYLKAIFLPTLGGRLISLYDKKEKRELLFANKKLLTRNCTRRGAWFAGGIEWNVGGRDHSFITEDNVYASVQKDRDGTDFLRIYEFDKLHDLYWHIDFHLREGKRFLFAKVKIYNFAHHKQPLNCSINLNLPLTKNTRVFSGKNKVLSVNKTGSLDYMDLPFLPDYPHLDASYPHNFPLNKTYYFTDDAKAIPYSVAIEKDGKGILEFSTKPLYYRKVETLGAENGGKRWNEALTGDRETQFFEIQGGLSPTILNGMYIDEDDAIDFTWGMGAIEVNPKCDSEADYLMAQATVEKEVEKSLKFTNIEQENIINESCTKIKSGTILNTGSYFGALHQMYKGITLPVAFQFSTQAQTASEKIYNLMIHQDTDTAPLVSLNWKDIEYPPLSWHRLFKEMNNPFAHYLYSMYLIENQRDEEALLLLEKTYKKEHNCYIARTIAVLFFKQQDYPAEMWYETALKDTEDMETSIALIEEYTSLLLKQEKMEQAKQLLENADNREIRKKYKIKGNTPLYELSDTIAMMTAQVAAYFEDMDTLGYILFYKDVSNVAFLENPYPPLYWEYMALKEAKRREMEVNDDIRNFVKRIEPLPPQLDFTIT